MNTQSRGRIDFAVVALLVIVMAVTFLALVNYFARTIQHPQRRSCSNNLHQLGLAVGSYVSDWDDIMPGLSSPDQKVPEDEAWPGLLVRYVKNRDVLRCPEASEDRLAYAYNRRVLRGTSLGLVHNVNETIIIFDSINDSPRNNNLNGDRFWRHCDRGLPKLGILIIEDGRYTNDWPDWAKPRHQGSNVLVVDGSVHSADRECMDMKFELE